MGHSQRQQRIGRSQTAVKSKINNISMAKKCSLLNRDNKINRLLLSLNNAIHQFKKCDMTREYHLLDEDFYSNFFFFLFKQVHYEQF
jgi:hypothetical protein